MKRLFAIAISALILSTNVNAVSYNSDPKIFITELVGDAIKILSDKTITKEEKSQQIEKIAIENVDINALGMYTLGDVRKTLDVEKLNTYKKLFEKYFLKSLTSRLKDYSENKFEVIVAEQKSSSYTIVKSKILKNSEQPEIKIDWRVFTKDPSKPLIRD